MVLFACDHYIAIKLTQVLVLVHILNLPFNGADNSNVNRVPQRRQCSLFVRWMNAKWETLVCCGSADDTHFSITSIELNFNAVGNDWSLAFLFQLKAYQQSDQLRFNNYTNWKNKKRRVMNQSIVLIIREVADVRGTEYGGGFHCTNTISEL